MRKIIEASNSLKKKTDVLTGVLAKYYTAKPCNSGEMNVTRKKRRTRMKSRVYVFVNLRVTPNRNVLVRNQSSKLCVLLES